MIPISTFCRRRSGKSGCRVHQHWDGNPSSTLSLQDLNFLKPQFALDLKEWHQFILNHEFRQVIVLYSRFITLNPYNIAITPWLSKFQENSRSHPHDLSILVGSKNHSANMMISSVFDGWVTINHHVKCLVAPSTHSHWNRTGTPLANASIISQPSIIYFHIPICLKPKAPIWWAKYRHHLEVSIFLMVPTIAGWFISGNICL